MFSTASLRPNTNKSSPRLSLHVFLPLPISLYLSVSLSLSLLLSRVFSLRGSWKHICGPGPVVLHALGFRLSFGRRAAPNLKRGSATPLCNHPLVFHFKGPARARQSLANIFVIPSACIPILCVFPSLYFPCAEIAVGPTGGSLGLPCGLCFFVFGAWAPFVFYFQRPARARFSLL